MVAREPASGTVWVSCRPTVKVMSLAEAPFRNRWLALPSKATFLTVVSMRRVRCPLTQPERFRPHEQNGLVARFQPLRVAAAQIAERRVNDGP